MITIQGLMRWLLDFEDPIKCTNEDGVGGAGNTKFYAKLFLPGRRHAFHHPILAPVSTFPQSAL